MNRRDFLKLSSAATAGLLVGIPLRGAESSAAGFGAFLQIATDDVVTIWVSKSDMGQGVRTALPMIVAEELDADWERVRVRQAPLDPKFGRQGTGGSGSVRTLWTPLREAGASARAMLVAAAAERWNVQPAQVRVSRGVVSAGLHKATFGELAADAAKITLTAKPPLKDPATFSLVGKATKRIDAPDMITGKAGYGIDVKVPGMLYAAVRRSPVFGGTVAGFDATKARAMAGVKQVVELKATGIEMPWNGVAVIATSTWAALKGRDALVVAWDEGPHANESTASLREAMAELDGRGKVIFTRGDVAAALAGAAKTVDAVYETPYLAHAPMEPMNATASVRADGVEVWAPTQFPDRCAEAVAAALSVPAASVRVNVTLLGGGFGRRINNDYAVEAALLSRAAGAPVKVQWTREDDVQHDFYHPQSRHHVTASLDGKGRVQAWRHRFVSASRRQYQDPATEAPHDSENAGLADLGWVIPNVSIEYAPVPSGVPRGAWRAVAHATNGFVICSALDELAHAAGRDPIEFLLDLHPPGKVVEHASEAAKPYPFRSDRLRRVIELVRETSRWRSPLSGRTRGFAAYYAFLTYAAEVAEVSIGPDGAPRVHRVVCAIDCGTAVNPDGIRAQIEGGVVYGLAAALGQKITIENGRVQQSNFHDLPLLTLGQMPLIEVHIVPGHDAPTGVGEPGLPPAAAAVANAIFRATGSRVRRLPFEPIA